MQHLEALGAGDLMDEVQPDEQLRLAALELLDGVGSP
jgi:hypothetical protein